MQLLCAARIEAFVLPPSACLLRFASGEASVAKKQSKHAALPALLCFIAGLLCFIASQGLRPCLPRRRRSFCFFATYLVFRLRLNIRLN
jgi:hypothetical protein